MSEGASRPPGRASGAPLIPGIYSYCDQRCERCRFAQRCLSYLERQRFENGELDLDDEPDADLSLLPAGLAGYSALESTLSAMTPEDSVRLDSGSDVSRERLHAHPLVIAARQYALTAWKVTGALWAYVQKRGDPAVLDAVESVAALADVVASKTYRAVSGSLDPGFDARDVASDANGSAKIARLVVDESRRAWRTLIEVDRPADGGVPERLIRALDEIDVGLAARFPRAMDFVRPGFDGEVR